MRPSTGWRKAWAITPICAAISIDQVERLLVAARLATAQAAYLRAATLFGLADKGPQPHPL